MSENYNMDTEKDQNNSEQRDVFEAALLENIARTKMSPNTIHKHSDTIQTQKHKEDHFSQYTLVALVALGAPEALVALVAKMALVAFVAL